MVSENAGQMQAHRNEVEQRMRDEAGGGGGGGLAAGYLGNLESMAAVVDDAFQKLEELREYQFQIFQNHILLEGTKDEEEKAVLESMLDPTKGCVTRCSGAIGVCLLQRRLRCTYRLLSLSLSRFLTLLGLVMFSPFFFGPLDHVRICFPDDNTLSTLLLLQARRNGHTLRGV